jgi:hypothetical protein
MKFSPLRGGRVLASAFLTVSALLLAGMPAHAAKPDTNSNGNKPSSASSVSYSGRAVALRIDGVTQPVAGPIIVCDTGELPHAGGFIQRTEANVNIASGALKIANAEAQVSGSGPETAAESTLTGYRVEFVVDDNGHTHRALIEADFVHAEVSASVDKKGLISLRSQVLIQGLKVNGRAIVVTGAANQRVDLPPEVGGYLILNEQASAGGSGGSGDVGVSAIHFYVCHCIEGHVGFVNAGITAQGTPPAPEEHECGKVTGGGWITGTPSGAKGTFGMSGGIRRGEFWGHLTFQDHGTSMKVQSTAVTGFAQDPGDRNGRIITYSVTINGTPGTARLRVVDNGEPGRTDIFDLTLSTGYRASGDLGGARPGGGNIQLHKCPPGWE